MSKMVSHGPVWPARLRLHSAGGVAGHMTELEFSDHVGRQYVLCRYVYKKI